MEYYIERYEGAMINRARCSFLSLSLKQPPLGSGWASN